MTLVYGALEIQEKGTPLFVVFTKFWTHFSQLIQQCLYKHLPPSRADWIWAAVVLWRI